MRLIKIINCVLIALNNHYNYYNHSDCDGTNIMDLIHGTHGVVGSFFYAFLLVKVTGLGQCSFFGQGYENLIIEKKIFKTLVDIKI